MLLNKAISNGVKAVEKGTKRVSRTPDTDKLVSTAIAPPPPPGDAISWPTPDSAQGEEKKKAQERAEKGEKEKTPTGKPHGKEKWMPVPYVPTAVFNTPLPPARRGGRPARGGRENSNRGGNAAHGNGGTDKASMAPPEGPLVPAAANSNERGRAELSSTKHTSGSPRTKRAASAGPATIREQRKAADSNPAEKPRDSGVSSSKMNLNTGPIGHESRRASAATQTDDPKGRRLSTNPNQQIGDSGPNVTKASQYTGERDEKYHYAQQDNQANPRSAASDRRGDGSVRSPDNLREFHGHLPNRERGEGRERGRGGYRGRGAGNHGFPSSSNANGQSLSHSHPPQNQATSPHQQLKSQSNHDRHGSQPQGIPFNPSQPISRGYRSNSRSQSIPHSTPYGRFPNGTSGPHPGPPQLSNLQTDLANTYGYQPGQQGIMSAMPYTAYMEQISLFGMVSMQM